MTLDYHLVSSAGRYVRLGGTPAAPVIVRDVDINPADNRRMYCVWSHDGTTLWAGGDNYASPPSRSHGLWKSEDGGATWIDKTALLPGTLGYGEVWEIAGWFGDPDWIAGVTNGAGNWYLCKYNSVSDTLEIKETLPTSTSRPTSIWAVKGTDVAYSNCQWPRTIYRTLDRGNTWTNDSSFPTSSEQPCHIAADADGNIYVHARPDHSTPVIYEGTWGGPWTGKTTVLGVAYWNYGRHLCMDELGVPWDYTLQDERIWRRNPTSGLWELVYGPHSYASFGAFWVHSSESIILSGGSSALDIYDGVAWHHHTPASIGLVDGSYYGIWSEAGDTEPPVITPLAPASEQQGVAKNATIKFTITDDFGVDLSTVKVWVDGLLIYSHPNVISGWGASVVAIPDGYQIELVQTSRDTYYRGNEAVTVRVYGEDTAGNPADVSWRFYTSPNMSIRVYPMILGSIRDLDEEQG